MIKLELYFGIIISFVLMWKADFLTSVNKDLSFYPSFVRQTNILLSDFIQVINFY